jgi:hypothetical protein
VQSQYISLESAIKLQLPVQGYSAVNEVRLGVPTGTAVLLLLRTLG